MYLVVGLGNPENDYAGTRHNMGFDVINELAKQYETEIKKEKFKSLYGVCRINDKKTILVKPQTYMNLSGESVIEWKSYLKVENMQLIVISDDIDLEPGKIRIRKKGSAGTHNGLKSVIHNLKTEEFIRVRVGVGKPEQGKDLIEYVIGYVSKEEKEKLQKGITLAKEAIIAIIEKGTDRAMNIYN